MKGPGDDDLRDTFRILLRRAMPDARFRRAAWLLLCAGGASACTTVMAGRKTTADGSTLLLHTDDCAECDFRLARVHPAAAEKRSAVLKFVSTYPREVSDRSATYAPGHLDAKLPEHLLRTWRDDQWRVNQTLGELGALDPAVAAALGVDLRGGLTYGTLEGLYSIINSEQVAVVESTAQQSALLPGAPPRGPGQSNTDGPLWDISALTKAALARCATARCAIDLMGYLAVNEGFYNIPPAYSGETLLVADTREGWAFHIAPLTPEVPVDGIAAGRGHSAVWVAQRVPDDHFTAIANRYTIRDVIEVLPDKSTPLTHACRGETFRYSDNMFAVAEYLARALPVPKPLEGFPPDRLGVRTGSDGLRTVDWTATFGGDLLPYFPPYSNDRVWRVLSLFAPKKNWVWPPPTPLATDAYPFSAAPDRPLTREDFLGVLRDVYRGAEHHSIDLTRGLAAGPWGDPSRYDPEPVNGANGSFPRAISMFRTSYSHVTEIGRRGGKLVGARIWAAQGAPHASMYTPIHVLPAAIHKDAAEARHVAPMPPSLTVGSLRRADAFDASPAHSSVFWRTTVLNNWARAVGFDFAWDAIEAAQSQVDALAVKAAEEAEAKAALAGSPAEAAELLAAADEAAARRSAERHRDLLIGLVTNLHDGYKIDPYALPFMPSKIFYPRWWLEQVGYYHAPLYPLEKEKPISLIEGRFGAAGPTVLSKRTSGEEQSETSAQPTVSSWQVVGLWAALFSAGVVVGCFASPHTRRMEAAIESIDESDRYHRITSS